MSAGTSPVSFPAFEEFANTVALFNPYGVVEFTVQDTGVGPVTEPMLCVLFGPTIQLDGTFKVTLTLSAVPPKAFIEEFIVKLIFWNVSFGTITESTATFAVHPLKDMLIV